MILNICDKVYISKLGWCKQSVAVSDCHFLLYMIVRESALGLTIASWETDNHQVPLTLCPCYLNFYTHTHKCLFVCVCVYVCIYIYIYIYNDWKIHAHIYRWACLEAEIIVYFPLILKGSIQAYVKSKYFECWFSNLVGFHLPLGWLA